MSQASASTNAAACVICSKCQTGPLTRPAFRRIINGEEFIYKTTCGAIETAAAEGCGLCNLLKTTYRVRDVAHSDVVPSMDVHFRLAIKSEDCTNEPRLISPKGVQYLDITPSFNSGKRFYIYSSTDDPSAAEVVARPPILDVGSPLAYGMALKCLRDCIAHHHLCPKPDPHASLPSRVIDCKNPTDPRIFISKGVHAPYIALSYVWGGPQAYCLTQSNIDKYVSKGISQHVIPQTICDAIEVTTKIGLQYLWVDAVCIIQDSNDDKSKELPLMGRIYRDAYLTIIASSATSANAGFLQKRVLSNDYAGHIRIPFHCQDGRIGSLFAFSADGPAILYHPMEEPINSRAWCLQERLLSPRKLVYSTESVEYHCQTALAEIGGAISGKPIGERLPSEMFGIGVTTPISAWTNVVWQSLHEEWRMIVSNYTRRGLSYQGDKLPAFAGVAEEFKKIWGPKSGRYIAGLWENLLPHDLLWSRQSWYDTESDFPVRCDPLTPRLSQSFAPSWSWASVDGHILPDATAWADRNDPACQVLRCDITLIDEQMPYGHVAASLTLHATIIPAPWIVLPTIGDSPEKYLSLYSPTDFLRKSLTVPQIDLNNCGRQDDVVIGEMTKLGSAGEVVHTHKVTITRAQLSKNVLLLHEIALEEDPSLLSYLGDITVFYDSPEQIQAHQVSALVVKRFSIDENPGAEGLLITSTGSGHFRRIGFWTSFVQPRNRTAPQMPSWFEADEYGATLREIVLV